MKMTPQLKAIFELLGAGFHASMLGLHTKPLAVLLSASESLENVALRLLFDADVDQQHLIRKMCLQDRLKLLLAANRNDPSITVCYENLCAIGFSSEAQLVTCAVQYANWLRERDRDELADAVFENAASTLRTKELKTELERYRRKRRT